MTMADPATAMKTPETARAALRILYLLDHTEPAPEGGAVVQWIRRLAAKETQAAVCSIGPYGCVSDDILEMSVPCVTLEKGERTGLSGFKDDVAAILGFRALVEKYAPDVCHFYGPRAELVGRFACSMTKTPWVATLSPGAERRGFRRIFYSMASGAARGRFLAADEDVRENALASGTIEEPIEIIGHGFDFHAMRMGPTAPEEVIPREGLKVGLPLVPGATDALREMLEAFKIFAALRPDIKLVILADRKDVRLEPWEKDLKLESRILCVKPGREWAAVLRRLDILWVHGRPKPDSRMILNAFAVGLPVVCDHTTLLAPYVRSIGGALMRDGAWPRQFAEASREIVENPELGPSLGRAGKIVVEKHFAMAPFIDRLRAIYAGVQARA